MSIEQYFSYIQDDINWQIIASCPLSRISAIFRTRLIDRLLLHVHWAVFQLYSGRDWLIDYCFMSGEQNFSYIQDEIDWLIIASCPLSSISAIFRTTLIDWLLLHVHWAVFQLYSGRDWLIDYCFMSGEQNFSYIQDEINWLIIASCPLSSISAIFRTRLIDRLLLHVHWAEFQLYSGRD